MTATMAETKRARVGLYLEPELFEVLQALATKEKRSVSNMVEVMIAEGLERRGLIEEEPLPKLKRENGKDD